MFNLPNKPNISSAQSLERISQQIQLETNMFEMQVQAPQSSDSEDQSHVMISNICCFQYDVQFDPIIQEDNRTLRYQIFKAAKRNIEVIIGRFSFSGKNLFSMRRIPEQRLNEILEIDSINIQGINYSVRLVFSRCFEISEDDAGVGNPLRGSSVIQVLNIILKNYIRDLNYKEIGKNSKFFDLNSKKEVKILNKQGQIIDTPLLVYRGLSIGTIPTSTKLYQMIDYTSRIIRQENALQYMARQSNDIVGQSVVTEYNNYQMYQIVRVDENKNPLSTFLNRQTNLQISYKDYYKTRYNVIIRDLTQPLLQVRNSKIQIIDEVYLVPELCKMTGMTERQRSNKNSMKQISSYTQLKPHERLNFSKDSCRSLANIYNSSGISINSNNNKIPAFLLNPPKISFGANKFLTQRENFDMRVQTFDQIEFKDWLIIFNQNDREVVDEFIRSLKKASQSYGINVNDPFKIEIRSWSPNDWINTLDRDFTQNDLPQFVVTFGNVQNNLYQEMKKFLSIEVGIESQHVTKRALERNTLSVASKIALQIAAKIGKKIWRVELPIGINPHTMIIGIETSMKRVQNSQIIGVVASINSDFTKYYSEVEIRDDNSTTLPTLSKIIKNCIVSYQKNMKKELPDEIIIYRQGLGEGQILQSQIFEINAVKEGFCLFNKDYKPRFAFFQVNKKIGQKFYSRNNQGIINPSSGTIVASEVVRINFEFFMCAQNCNIGVCTPTKYTCLFNNTNLLQDQFWQLTYFQTFNYYNWQGPIRVPAVMKYAEKLAKFTSEVLEEKALDSLQQCLYYI